MAGATPHVLSIISAQRATDLAHSVGGTVRKALFKAIVGDLETLRNAYSRAGLLTDGGQGSMAYSLLGGGEAADRFRRDTLLLDAVLRNRVARLVFDRRGPKLFKADKESPPRTTYPNVEQVDRLVALMCRFENRFTGLASMKSQATAHEQRQPIAAKPSSAHWR
jgi:hypothetical protein